MPILMRKCHRILAIVFTLTVALNFAVMAFRQPPAWVTYAPLPVLFLMLATGLYLLVLPWRRRPGYPAA
jgi:hypothetical protein